MDILLCGILLGQNITWPQKFFVHFSDNFFCLPRDFLNGIALVLLYEHIENIQ